MRWEGVFVANITPFNAKGGIDWEGFEHHLSFLTQSGVQGMVPCGTTGEAATLSFEEWKKVVTFVTNYSKKNNHQIIAGCGSNSTSEVIELCQEAGNIGAEAALVVTPYYNKPTVAGLLAHYSKVADSSPLPILLYHVPGRTGISLTIETIAELFKHPNIVGIKEASGSYGLWQQISQYVDTSTKSFLAGDDEAFTPIALLGGCGIISASANVIPKHFVELHHLNQAKNWEKANLLQLKVSKLIKALFTETNPAPTKFALSRMMELQNSLRLPLVPVTPSTEKQILEALRSLEVLA